MGDIAATPNAPYTTAQALRLTFEWTGGAIALRDVQHVAKRAPAADRPQRIASGKREAHDAAAHRVGIWLELHDGDRVTWLRQVGPMFPDSHEVQTGDPHRPFARVPRNRPYRVDLLVPAPSRGKGRIVLRERRADPDAKRGAAPREIVHVDAPLEDAKRTPSDPSKRSQ